jgi:hypothetical protein
MGLGGGFETTRCPCLRGRPVAACPAVPDGETAGGAAAGPRGQGGNLGR